MAAAPPPSAEPGAARPVRDGRVLPRCPRCSSSASGWSIRPSTRSSAASSASSGYLGTWVGFDNYKRLFTTSTLPTAIKNNAIWVAVVPAFVTAFGLIFAVLTERVRWAVAFKTVVFLPMAISAFATGVTWRIMYQQDPNVGAINALGKVAVDERLLAAGVLSSALPVDADVSPDRGAGLVLKTPLQPGGVARLGLTGIAPDGGAEGREAGGRAGGEAGRHRRRRLARLQARRRRAGQGRARRARAARA